MISEPWENITVVDHLPIRPLAGDRCLEGNEETISFKTKRVPKLVQRWVPNPIDDMWKLESYYGDQAYFYVMSAATFRKAQARREAEEMSEVRVKDEYKKMNELQPMSKTLQIDQTRSRGKSEAYDALRYAMGQQWSKELTEALARRIDDDVFKTLSFSPNKIKSKAPNKKLLLL